MDEAKKRAVEALESRLVTTYKEAIPRDMQPGAVEAIGTGIPALDLATGVGGLPRGRIVEVYGAEGSGKTAVALSTIAEVQRSGGVGAFIDAEHALTPSFATMLGVKWEDLLLARPDKGEDCFAIMEDIALSGVVDVITLDSVASLVAAQELEGDYGDPNVAALAKLMSQSLRRMSGVIARTNAVAIFVNQMREKPPIGTFNARFAPKEQTAGGRALRFYASMRIEVAQSTVYKQGDLRVGHRCRAKIQKNKVAAPFEQAEWDLYYRNCVVDGQAYEPGIDWLGAAIDGALGRGIITQRSSFYYLVVDDVEILKTNGLKAFRKALETDESLLDAFLERI